MIIAYTRSRIKKFEIRKNAKKEQKHNGRGATRARPKQFITESFFSPHVKQ
jgi:hypothetical protein